MQTLRIGSGSFVVSDDEMAATLQLARKASRLDLPILVSGESGTGKEFVARFIHENSRRASQPYVTVNCAAMPEGLIEAELFGYEKGAFTGAIASRKGKFEQASQGTLLLDEISEMPIHLQAKLLRVLQEGEVDRLGGNGTIPVQTRVIATTNRNPETLVGEGQLRGDLFYRINVIAIHCAPLRGRLGAVSRLSAHFLKEASGLLEVEPLRMDPDALDKLSGHNWPGNIRELRNTIQRAALVASNGTIEPDNIRFSGMTTGGQGDLASIEREHIVKVLEQSNGNRSAASRKLGITVRTLRNKLNEYEQG